MVGAGSIFAAADGFDQVGANYAAQL